MSSSLQRHYHHHQHHLPRSRPQSQLAQSIVKLILLITSVFPLFGSPIQPSSSSSSSSSAPPPSSSFLSSNHSDFSNSQSFRNPAHSFDPDSSYRRASFIFGSSLDGFVYPLREVQTGSPQFWWMLAVIVFLVLLGGCFAGLTLGLMGLDILNLRVLSTSGTLTEQVQAQKVLKLLERGRHWVLVVLLLSNVVVNETLPIFLDTVLGGGAAAILISTALIVIFGEIIPQSICVRYGLSIGAKSAPFVLALMYLEFPIAYPIALLLDYILGHDEGTTYRKAELKTFVGLHRHIGTDGLNEDEVTIISAVLDLSEKTIVDIMTPIEETFTLGEDSILDESTVTELVSQGYSRVPIHQTGNDRNFIGMLLVKHLISYDPEDAKPVRDFQLSTLPEGAADMTCLEALNFFQQGRSHMLLVSSRPGEPEGALGVVSLEDVIEEMIGEEIIDETDQYVDVAHKIKVVRKPLGPRPSTKGLAPLIKGVIEKRRHGGGSMMSRSDLGDGDEECLPVQGETGNLTSNHIGNFAKAIASNRSSYEVPSHTSWRSPVMDKVKVKGGDGRGVRTEAESRRRKIPNGSFHDVNQSISEERHHSNGATEDGHTETTPLLNQNESDDLLPRVRS